MKEIKQPEYINLSKVSEVQQRTLTGSGTHSRWEKMMAYQHLIRFVELVDRGISMNLIDKEDLAILDKVFAGLYHYQRNQSEYEIQHQPQSLWGIR